MASEKRALMLVFRPEKLQATSAMRDLYESSYATFLNMEDLESKTWWCDQQKQE